MWALLGKERKRAARSKKVSKSQGGRGAPRIVEKKTREDSVRALTCFGRAWHAAIFQERTDANTFLLSFSLSL